MKNLPVNYNDNVKIISVVKSPVDKLKKNYYYALMVTDDVYKNDRPKEVYFDYDRSWIGLERTTNLGIYVSKDYSKRDNRFRGDTVIVEIKNIEKLCLLDY